MWRVAMLSLGLSLLAGSIQAGETRHQSFERTITKTVALKYVIYVPDGYQKEEDTRYPLILFLHGAGERGDDLSEINSLEPMARARSTEGFPFIVVSPQCPLVQAWDPDALNALLDKILTKYRVDPDAVYLTGYSMGGAGTWSLAIDHPERFAAIAPLCGRVIPLLACRIYQTPIWVFHGEKDDVVTISHSQEMVDVLRGMGNDRVKFTAYPDAGHDIWDRVYSGSELYDWFLEHRRTNQEQPQ